MQVVIDSSIAIKWFLTEPYSPEARRLLSAYQAGAYTFLAPDLINAEIGNILWKKHRFDGLTVSDALLILRTFQALDISFLSTTFLLEEAFNLAVTHGITVYDALYLAVSVRENCRFVTADEKLVTKAVSAFPNMIWIAKWPTTIP